MAEVWADHRLVEGEYQRRRSSIMYIPQIARTSDRFGLLIGSA
jgi:hypothetical protein